MAVDLTANTTQIKAREAVSFLVLVDGKITVAERLPSQSLDIFNNPIHDTIINEDPQ